ncbi:unnamed protein product [Rotaria sordida]|uniref:Uncharacterized protein n=1 Tax=Rotaria sordida TaxID=392033 RepID=A0A815I3L5_9BILA|nr:unnamed protein product [Rotaria sordida]CAF1362400.1 unnamed protein product [Rotaria sordida]
MVDEEIEELFELTGEDFYKYIEVQYGKNVEKVIRFHDIDSFLILGSVNQHDILDVVEQSNNENSSDQLIALQKEICNTFENKVTIKIGTKGKLILLLKSAHDIMRKRNHFLSLTRQTRTNNHRSLSSSTNSSGSGGDVSSKDNYEYIQQCIMKMLINMKNTIHGVTQENISVNDFKIFLNNLNDDNISTCIIQCVCGDRIKLYSRYGQFQISNFSKHLKTTNKKSIIITNNKTKETDTSEGSNEMLVGDEQLEDENKNSFLNKSQNKCNSINTSNTLDLTLVTSKKSYDQRKSSDSESDNDENSDSSAKPTNEKNDGGRRSHILPIAGETQNSISFNRLSQSKKQQAIEDFRTSSLPPNIQSIKSVKDLNRKDNTLLDARKSKRVKNDKQPITDPSAKDKKAPQEHHVLINKNNKSDFLCTALKTIDVNNHRAPNHYRYPESVLRFATALFILAGIYVYEYVRLNFKFLLPTIQTIKNNWFHEPYSEGKFRFDETKTYCNSVQCQYIFVSEDSSALIPRIEYDASLDIFNGFETPLAGGIPCENAFRCTSFSQLKYLCETVTPAHLVNVHCVQPIPTSSFTLIPSSIVLGAYELKQFEVSNNQQKIIFPIHHKVKPLVFQPGSKINNDNVSFDIDTLEKIILQAYQVAQEMTISVGMSHDLGKNNLFNIEESSQLVKQLLKSNSLSESEALIVDESSEDDTAEEDEELDDVIYDDDLSEDDASPTSSFDNLQHTPFSGIYQTLAL